MSSIACPSSSTAYGVDSGSSITLTITAPTGIALGDLLIAAICGVMVTTPDGDITLTAPSGWTQLIIEQTNGNYYVYYKIATSTEVAAANFVFTAPEGAHAVNIVGGIARFTGVDQILTIPNASNSTKGTGSSITGAGITPTVQCLLVMIGEGYNVVATRTASGYGVANNNPTWTEIFDDGTGPGTIKVNIAMATGGYTVANGATGNASITFSGSEDVSFIALLALSPAVVRPSILAAVSALISPTTILAILPAIVGMVSALPVATINLILKTWSDAAKSATTWLDATKH